MLPGCCSLWRKDLTRALLTQISTFADLVQNLEDGEGT